MIEILCNELVHRKIYVSFEIKGYELNMSGRVMDFSIYNNHVTLFLDNQVEINFDVENISYADEFDFVVNDSLYIALV